MKHDEFMKPFWQFRFAARQDMRPIVVCVFLAYVHIGHVLCDVHPDSSQAKSITDKVYAIKTNTGIKYVPLNQTLGVRLRGEPVRNSMVYGNSSASSRVPINTIKVSSKVIGLPSRIYVSSTAAPLRSSQHAPRRRKRPVIRYESDDDDDDEDEDEEDKDEEDEDEEDEDDDVDETEHDGEITLIANDKHDYEDVVYSDSVPLPSPKKKKKKIKSGFKLKDLKHLKKFMFPLLIAYKLKFFTLIPLLLGGLVLIVGTTGLAGFFFALFAVGLGLQKHH